MIHFVGRIMAREICYFTGCLAFLFLFASLHSEGLPEDPPVLLQWNQLHPSLHLKKVEVRGFLYRTSAGEVVLAAQPNVKSCCLGSPSKRQEQILIHGFEKKELDKKAVSLQGILHYSHPTYSLKEIESVKKSFSLWALAFPLLAIGWLIYQKLF